MFILSYLLDNPVWQETICDFSVDLPLSPYKSRDSTSRFPPLPEVAFTMSKTVKDLTAGTAGGIAQVRRHVIWAPTQNLHSSLSGPRRPTVRHCQSCAWKLRVFASKLMLTCPQRMQTSAKGTYTGMLHCATGILKNEGPLAFYKV